MKVKELIKNSKLNDNDIVQCLSKKEFESYLNNKDSSYKDIVKSELFTTEYLYLKDNKVLKKIKDKEVVFSYRKVYDEEAQAKGITLIIDVGNDYKELKSLANQELLLSDYSFGVLLSKEDNDDQ